jgi:hypothetical protein
MVEKHTTALSKFNKEFSKDLRGNWTDMISRWEKDKTQPNPYTHTEQGIAVIFAPLLHRANPYLASNMAEVRKMLAEADQRDAKQGPTPHQMPPSIFIRHGLELEDQQYAFFVHLLL